MGYSPWGLKELDTTERLSTAPCVFYTQYYKIGTIDVIL